MEWLLLEELEMDLAKQRATSRHVNIAADNDQSQDHNWMQRFKKRILEIGLTDRG